MIESSIFREPALIGYLVKSLRECHPDKQVGKTMVQKMVYLLVRRKVMASDYSMYHYGPYSSGVSGELNFAGNSGIVNIKWVENIGYSITPGHALESFEELITEKEKQQIEEIVKRFGSFIANELSLIATALYLKDNFGVPDKKLAEVIHNVKEQYSIKFAKKLLQKDEVVDELQIPC